MSDRPVANNKGDDTMGCGGQERTILRRRAAWSNGTTDNLFFCAAELPVNRVAGVRVSIDVEATTGGLYVERALRYSNDGVTWDTPTTFGQAASTSSGDSWGDRYEEPSVNFQRVQVGVVVRNGVGVTLRHQAQLNFKIDVREP